VREKKREKERGCVIPLVRYCLFMWRERERERARDRDRDREREKQREKERLCYTTCVLLPHEEAKRQ